MFLSVYLPLEVCYGCFVQFVLEVFLVFGQCTYSEDYLPVYILGVAKVGIPNVLLKEWTDLLIILEVVNIFYYPGSVFHVVRFIL